MNDDYIDTLTPETPVIDITTQVTIDENAIQNTEKATEETLIIDDVRPITEETRENVTETNSNNSTEEGAVLKNQYK